MKRWEYSAAALSAHDYETHMKQLNRQGAAGWELVQVIYTSTQIVAYMKRLIETEDGDGRQPA